MKKKLLLLAVTMLISVMGNAQLKLPSKLSAKKPGDVVKSVFISAKTGNFNYLYQLCDPNGYSDRDCKRICSITQLAYTVEGSTSSESAKQNLSEFVNIFKDGKITGEITYERDGKTTYAKIPFWYNHPLGENRSNEIMTLVKRSDKWYLYSF
jgi:hypothetical protein